MKALAAALVLLSAGTFAGVLLEHYVGTSAVMDWTGLRHAILVRQWRSAGNRLEVPVDGVRESRPMVALVFGQSNAANSGETPGAANSAVYELYHGRLFEARDPLLGAEGSGGSVWTRLGAKAVASGQFRAVVLVPIAFSATEIARWAPGGSLHDALLDRIAQAHAGGLRFTHLLWHQGEADAQRGTPEAAYRESFLAMLAAIRQLGVDAPIYVATASRCGKMRASDEVRHAQTALIDPAAGILAGPDTDALGLADRYDGCHFSSEGLEKAAELWWQAIRPKPGK
jgi:hypothetical protein